MNDYVWGIKDVLVPILYMRGETKAYDYMASSRLIRDLTQYLTLGPMVLPLYQTYISSMEENKRY